MKATDSQKNLRQFPNPLVTPLNFTPHPLELFPTTFR